MAFDQDTTADAVRAGMELLVWQVEVDHWNEVGLANVAANRKGYARNLAVLPALSTAIILAVLLYFWPSAVMLVVFLASLVLLPAAGFITYAATLATTRVTLGPDLPVVGIPPRVILTSNGILLGGRAWLWRADHYRLAQAEIDGDDPVTLRLAFRGTGWRRFLARETIDIPFPSDFDHDLTEIKQLLDIKTRLKG